MTTEPKHRILVTVEGGVIQNIDHIPAGVSVEVRDYDKNGDRTHPSWSEEHGAFVGVWDGTGEIERDTTDRPDSSPRVLPPDPDGMNDDRSEWAGKAIETFRETTGSDEEDALSDLLIDLMHWADRSVFDFDASLNRARNHYQAETAKEAL